MIEAKELTRRFGEFVAVERVSLRVPDGTILALLGPNGAGKTTTVRMLAGLLAPSAGDATVAGCDVRREPAAVRLRVGLVTDVPGLYEQMTLPAYLDFFGALYGLSRPVRARRAGELIAFFGLEAHQRERMAGFSKGMKQKVALARALLHDPAALFLDEPTAGLDPMAARSVRELIVGLKHASRSIVLCTHDLDEAERLAEQVAILRHGRVVACDAPAALRAQASPDTSVLVELAQPCPAAVEALLAIAGVTAPCLVAPEPHAVAPHTLLEYHTAEPATINPRVIARLVAEGAQVVAVTCATRTLEDVYADMMSTEHPAAAGTGVAGASRAAVAAGRERAEPC